jgi:hypothetical protein
VRLICGGSALKEILFSTDVWCPKVLMIVSQGKVFCITRITNAQELKKCKDMDPFQYGLCMFSKRDLCEFSYYSGRDINLSEKQIFCCKADHSTDTTFCRTRVAKYCPLAGSESHQLLLWPRKPV